MDIKTITIKTIEKKINKYGTPIIIINDKYKALNNGEVVGKSYRYLITKTGKYIIPFTIDLETI